MYVGRMVSEHTLAQAPARLGYADLRELMSLMTGDEKHSEAATSTLDVLWLLHDRILRVDPSNPTDPGRDRFHLSKGHGPMAYFAVLAAKGFIDPDLLSGFGTFDSPLGHHPDRLRLDGVETSSGSLGHGLPIALGTVFALNLGGLDGRVFVMMGDGELDEGSNHEAIALAGRLGMERLTAIVVDNGSAAHGWPDGIGRRFEVEGWASREVDGRDHAAIEAALRTEHDDRPLVVVAKVGSSHG
mgnify:CR=1 FL=1